MPVNVSNSQAIILETNGSIKLAGDYGTKAMVLSSNGNGQAYWDWIDYAAQHPGSENTFKDVMMAGVGDTPIGTGQLSGSEPGSIWATTAASGTGYRAAVICMHCSFHVPDSAPAVMQARVSTKVVGGGYIHADWSTAKGTSKLTSPSVSVPGGGSYGGSTISWNNEQFHGVHAFSVQTVCPLDPTKSYQIVGGGSVYDGPSAALYDGSVRALFFK